MKRRYLVLMQGTVVGIYITILTFPGLLLRTYFWQATKNFDEIGFSEAIKRIKDTNIEAWTYLMKIPKTAWQDIHLVMLLGVIMLQIILLNLSLPL